MLPGFPTSAVFTFHEFVAPVIRELAGLPPGNREQRLARLATKTSSERGRLEYLLVGLVRRPDVHRVLLDGNVAVGQHEIGVGVLGLGHRQKPRSSSPLVPASSARGPVGSRTPSPQDPNPDLVLPEYVAILYEMIHDARIIPLDGRAHIDKKIHLWMGDSRGRWEGDTLVVETANHTDKGWIASNGASRRIKGIPQSEALHVVERFTRVSAGTIEYEVTIEDPAMYTRPWKVAMPLTRDDGYQMYEYACHEGNKAVELILGGARNLEKEAEIAARQGR